MSSCHNDEIDFPDYDYTSVYFASQYPLRTLELGDDPLVDLTLDKQHKVRITATMGGVYSNTEDRIIDFVVDESLTDGISFADGSDLDPLPREYYDLLNDEIVIEAGSILGGVEVQLTPAFFEDSLSINKHYVIPLLMTDEGNTDLTKIDSILSGRPAVENPNRFVSSDWEIVPKNYVLYGIKYVNPWHGIYLRRGEDQISDGSTTVTDVRREEYVEYDEVVHVSTVSYTEASLPLTIYEDDDLTTRANIELLLSFDENNGVTISSNSPSYTATGTGMFVTDGEENSVGGLDRDALYLDYTVELTDLGYTYSTKDTLVLRNRGIVPEYFNVTLE
ncbi:DUF5627 domain-containing protein [Autumnicola musiva]|uniref:DUF5627 domain-containing protein n=1 Tax=Autumnicola musiva TaxID=3075589 RepID=A0ABU3D4T3_9FLAO|nr:DUF5627 domain-containing protein [Zunongwangia sp. F117]MDT0676542.1 DUF5627 domain-containing protein [Zunongwangia sp. F117]